eukprot:2837678-Rhodomonas_salina.3
MVPVQGLRGHDVVRHAGEDLIGEDVASLVAAYAPSVLEMRRTLGGVVLPAGTMVDSCIAMSSRKMASLTASAACIPIPFVSTWHGVGG